jgi:hypothetical protein
MAHTLNIGTHKPSSRAPSPHPAPAAPTLDVFNANAPNHLDRDRLATEETT